MRATFAGTTRRVCCSVTGLLVAAATAGAQLPNASPAAFGMAGNYTAMARGYEAIAWNPANLAMPGRPLISLGLGVVGGTVGMDPVDFKMFHNFSGQVIDSTTRAAWVSLVQQSRRQRLRVDGGVTPFALSVGPVGLSASTSSYTNIDLSPDAFEAILFGNAGNNGGQPKDLDLTGTGVSAGVISTGALSFALPVPFKFTAGILPNERLAIGITGKYVVGHMLLQATDGGSVFGANSMTYTFPAIMPSGLDSTATYDGQVGIGTGADVAASWSAGPWKVGVLMENVFNSFKWDTTKLAFNSIDGYFDQDTSYTTDGEQPYGMASPTLRAMIAAQAFKPAFNIGIAFKPTSFLTITADMHEQTGGDDAISIGPKKRMGVGMELRIVPFIPLRGGVASVSDGWQAGAGFGIHLLGYELGVAGSLRRRGAANESGLMVGLVGIGR